MILPDLHAFEADAAAGPILDMIRQERWRKARDAAKDLCRKDKTAYLPLLVAANAGLAQDLLNRGLVNDAAPVLEYLKTIAPPELLIALHDRRVESQTTAARQKAAGGRPEEIAVWRLAESAAQALDAGQEPGNQAIRAADSLVTAGGAVPEGGSPFLAEVRSVRTAVQATGDGLWEVAREALQALPRRSLFAHWRFFLRGVRHTHLGEKADAQRCFDALPAESSLQRAAALYRDLLGLPQTAVKVPEEASLPLLAVLSGVPSWVAPITESQRYWKRGQLDKAYDALANPLRQHFPTDEPGPGGLLTDLMLASCAGRSPLPHDAQQDLVSLFLSRYHDQKFRSDRERLFALRFFLHEDRKSLDPDIAEKYGAELAKVWTRLRKQNPLRESAIWSMIAADQMPAGQDGTLRRPPKFGRKALQHIHEKAASLDPENPVPGVRLARFHLSAGNQSGYNNQLTSLVKIFPEAKAVLLLSAEESIRRKSWPKALKTLRQARTADPADSTVISLFITALQEQAAAIFRKSQPVPGSHWEELEPLLLDLPSLPAQVPSGFPLDRSRWVAYTLQGMLARTGREEEAVRLAPSAWSHHYLLHILHQCHRLPVELPSPEDAVTWRDLLWMALLLEWDGTKRLRKWQENLPLGNLLKVCIGRLIPGSKLTEDPGGLLAAVHRLQKGALECQRDNHLPWSNACRELSSLIGPASRKKGASYQIRIAACLLPDRWEPPDVLIGKLQALMEEATTAGDIPARDFASQALTGLEERTHQTVPPPWEIDDEADDDDDDEDYDDEDLEGFLDAPPKGMVDKFAVVRCIAAAMKILPKERLKELKSRIMAAGIDLADWTTLEAVAKLLAANMTEKQAREILDSSALSPSPLPPPALPPVPPRKTKPPTPPDPTQPELF